MKMYLEKKKSKSNYEYVVLSVDGVCGDKVVLSMDNDIIVNFLDCKPSYLKSLELNKEVAIYDLHPINKGV